MIPDKMYLGDGVYAKERADGAFVLTTENGLHITNAIVLEEPVFLNLVAFVRARCTKPEPTRVAR